jgi:hypothetical protein
MSSYDTVAAILSVWPQLPAAAGARWPSLYWQLLDLLRDFAATADEEEQAGLAIAMLRLLREAPEAVALLQPLLAPTGMAKGISVGRGAVTRGAAPGDGEITPVATGFAGTVAGVLQSIEALWRAPAAPRYTDIHAPARVQAGHDFPVVARLTCQPQADVPGVQKIDARPGQEVRVTLTAHTLEVSGAREKTLRIEADRDSEAATFFLRAADPGSHALTLDFWLEGHLVASVCHTLVAAADPVALTLAHPAPTAVAAPESCPYPDLILRISTQGGRLSFDLHFADTRFLHIEGERLRGDPEAYRYQLIREIENLAAGKDVDGLPLAAGGGPAERAAALTKGIAKIGQRLYTELFPEELRREYCQFREQVRTLQIISDEPWLPWELIKPYDKGVDDDFLCAQFDCARWVAPAPREGEAQVAVRSLACIVPDDSKLVAAQTERQRLQVLAKSRGLVDLTPAPPTKTAVEALLEGEATIGLWHFACHGDFDEKAPGNSPLLLQEQRRLRPNELVGKAVDRLYADRPLVFLNACRAGEQGVGLTGLGGWARKLVEECGVGALVAPLWAVNDGLAQQFAQAFYEAVQAPGMTLAQAMGHARAAIRGTGDPTWLAYTLYGHPNARVVF